MGRTVYGANCLWGEMSWGELWWGEFLWGELSWGESFDGASGPGTLKIPVAAVCLPAHSYSSILLQKEQ